MAITFFAEMEDNGEYKATTLLPLHTVEIYSYQRLLHFVLYLKYAGHNVTAEEVRDMEMEMERESK